VDVNLVDAKTIHDVLLKDAQDHSACELCAVSDAETAADAAQESRKEGTSMDAIYTQEQADSLITAARTEEQSKAQEAVASAVKDLEGKLEELSKELEELRSKRDEDQVELTASRDKVTELEGEIARRDEEVARIARRGDRVQKIGEVAKFSDKYVSENVDRWVDMSEDDFASYLEAIRELKAGIKPEDAAEKTEDTVVPEDTAMNNEHVETVETPARSKLFAALKGGNL
jgi:predicted nuclease with TOPRIM domain